MVEYIHNGNTVTFTKVLPNPATTTMSLTDRINDLAEEHLGHTDGPPPALLDRIDDELGRLRQLEKLAARTGERLKEGAAERHSEQIQELADL